MAEIDRWLIEYLNGYATRSEVLDKFVVLILQLPSVKLLPLVMLLVWLWFRVPRSDAPRSALCQGILGALLALSVSRAIQNLFPHRPRPLHDEALDFVLPYGVVAETLSGWSSFPSDNAALAFAISAALWRASRPLGPRRDEGGIRAHGRTPPLAACPASRRWPTPP